MGETAGGGVGGAMQGFKFSHEPAVSHSKILAQKPCSEERLERD